jgi:hypothetical protein
MSQVKANKAPPRRQPFLAKNSPKIELLPRWSFRYQYRPAEFLLYENFIA